MNKEQENQFKEYIKEMAREEIQRTFTDNLMETLNSVFIFKYVETLEQRYKKQKEVIDKAIEYINKYESIRAYYEYIDEDGYDEYNCDEDFKKELLDILDEVTNNE